MCETLLHLQAINQNYIFKKIIKKGNMEFLETQMLVFGISFRKHMKPF